MDLQTGLSRALLLLLFLHLMLLGRSHPLGGPSPAPHSELSGAQVSSAGLHRGSRTGYQAAEMNRPSSPALTEVTLRAREWQDWEPGPCAQGESPDHLLGTGGKLQEEQAAPEHPQQGRGSKAVGETRRAASAAGLGPQDKVLRGPKRMRDSGCFGWRMDRIGSFTGLGCNVLKRH
ncbi:natriuretic peptides B [Pipistrellus kuhlii]|uniref:natriuretic peptides B n=1 Tax=Pipistrellus kuhlii TaxID=59472 RepID=UPI001E274BAC|nr:natriuretic peptides B [Pipistrellus kuhlii]